MHRRVCSGGRAVGGRGGAKACSETLPVLPTPLGPLQEGKLPDGCTSLTKLSPNFDALSHLQRSLHLSTHHFVSADLGPYNEMGIFHTV